jgi:hypothetical protein
MEAAAERRFPAFWLRLVLALALLGAVLASVRAVNGHPGLLLPADLLTDVMLAAAVFVWCPSAFVIGPARPQREAWMLAYLFLAAVLLSMAVNVAVGLLAVHHPSATPGRYQVQPDQAHGAMGLVVLGVLGCLVAPIAENAFFFGVGVYLLRRARRVRWLGWPLAVAGLTLFTVAHGPSALMAPFYAAIGLVIILTYWRRGYAASVMMHGVFNATALYLLPLLAR